MSGTDAVQPPGAFYDRIGADYDLIIDWPRRLAREGALLRKLAAATGARTVLDVGGGTGRHAAYLRDELGLAVTLADPSGEALAEARRRLGADARLEQRGLGELGGLPEYDLVLCVGNTLPHVEDGAAFERALTDLCGRVRAGGLLLIHQLNYAWILADFAKRRFLPAAGSEERFFLRFFEREGERLRFTILRVRGAAGRYETEFQSTAHLPLLAEDYARVLGGIDGACPRFLGDWDESPYDAATSDVLMALVGR